MKTLLNITILMACAILFAACGAGTASIEAIDSTYQTYGGE